MIPRLRSHPVFSTALLLLLVAGLTGWVSAGKQRTIAHAAERASEIARIRLQQELETEPTLAASFREEVHNHSTALQSQGKKLRESPPLRFAVSPPNDAQTSEDLYFAMITMQEHFRENWKRAGIQVSEEAMEMGLTRFLRRGHGPPEEWIAKVGLQRKHLAWLLEALTEARPEEILAIATDPFSIQFGTNASRATGNSRSRVNTSTTPPESWRLRTGAVLESSWITLEFRGQTEVLRQFLTSLATSARPYSVRAVEVWPQGTPDPNVPAHNTRSLAIHFPSPEAVHDDTTPIVHRNHSQFRVILEWFHPTDEATIRAKPGEGYPE